MRPTPRIYTSGSTVTPKNKMRRQGRTRHVKAFGSEWSYVKYRSRLIKYVHMAQVIDAEVSRIGRRVKLLDAGSGKGRLSWYVKSRNIGWYGLDNDAKRTAQANRLGLYRMTMGDLQQGVPFRGDSFDIVVSSHVLEHLDKPQEAVKELHRVLKPGGLIIVGVPIYGPVLRIARLAIAPLINAYFKWHKGKPCDHHIIYTLNSLKKLMRSFKIEQVRGFRFGRGQFLIFLEDSRLLYELNTRFGAAFPSLSPEVNLVARK